MLQFYVPHKSIRHFGDLPLTYTEPFAHLDKNDLPSAGGKGANLGELTSAGFPVPPGFVLTTDAYDAFVQEHGLQQQILDLASGVSVDDPRSGEEASAALTALFLDAELPEAIREDLFAAYAILVGDGENGVAVRSSATAEDLPDASFAGQQETFLNVSGAHALVEAVAIILDRKSFNQYVVLPRGTQNGWGIRVAKK